WRVGVRTEGLVRSVLVNLGDAVRKDQVLARYHADEVREERAKYRTAVSELQRLEAAATLAKRNYGRMQSLLELNAAYVLQDNLGQLRVGQPVTVTLTGLGDQRFAGKITNLGQELDPTTRVMQVRIVLNNPGQRLRPEMLANAEIPIGETASVLSIPSDAIQQ